MLDALVALVVPPRCLACAAPARPGERLCGDCRADLPWLPAQCPRCALPRPCGLPCPAAGAAFAAAWAPLAFEGPARALVHALKFRGRTAAAPLMAAQLAANAPPGLFADASALVPVPTAPDRHRGRGFDHAALLARALAKRTGLVCVGALAHEGPSQRQLGKARAQRHRGPRIRARRPLEGTLALIDDVHTTGATLEACARALRAAGAGRVIAVSYARTLG